MNFEIFYINSTVPGIIMLDSDGIGGFLPDDTVFYQDYDKNESGSDRDKKWVRCRNCRGKIALNSEKISVSGAKVHIFKNPAGVIFRIICFSDAPGIINVTDYTADYSWFDGFLWSVSLCRFCGNHVGWHFNSGSMMFYGLIADRLSGL